MSYPILHSPIPIRASPNSASRISLPSNRSKVNTWRFVPLSDEDTQLAYMAEVERELRSRKEFYGAKSCPSLCVFNRPSNPMVNDEVFGED